MRNCNECDLLLIDLEEIRKYAPITPNAGGDNYRIAVLNAQRTKLLQVLCIELLCEIFEGKENGFTDDQEELMTWIKPYLAYCVWKEWLIITQSQDTPNGLRALVDPVLEQVDDRKLQTTLNMWEPKEAMALSQLQNYLHENKDKFPSYKNCGCYQKTNPYFSKMFQTTLQKQADGGVFVGGVVPGRSPRIRTV